MSSFHQQHNTRVGTTVLDVVVLTTVQSASVINRSSGWTISLFH
jgi:hypothetical protein